MIPPLQSQVSRPETKKQASRPAGRQAGFSSLTCWLSGLLACFFIAEPALAQNVIRGSGLPTTNSIRGSNTIAVTVFPYPHPNSTSGAGGTYQIALSNLASSLIVNQTWVQEGGSLYAAKLATPLYGTVSVGPGTYTNGVTNLFFNGSWEFHGSILDWMGQNTNGFGIFDDRYSGAVTNFIFGQVQLRY